MLTIAALLPGASLGFVPASRLGAVTTAGFREGSLRAEEAGASSSEEPESFVPATSSDSSPADVPLVEPIMRAEAIEGSRRKGQDSFADVDTQIFARNPVLDSVALPGDYGFDPFTFASDKATLLSHRGAEIRHSRLAMLAAVGWPLSELLQPKIADVLGLASNGLAKQSLAPSVLNGGLGDVPLAFWVVVVGATAFLEKLSLERESSGKMPGDLGFDPLGMGSKQMAAAEIMNGRVAMLAITGFAIQEALYRLAVVSETPFFFKPLF